MKKERIIVLKKVFKFVLVSGIGFIMDLIVYSILTLLLKMDLDISNMLSSIVGATFIFFTSTKKIFETNIKRISLRKKYIIYVIYQSCFIFLTSKVLLIIKGIIVETDVNFLINYVSIFAKIIVTPFTLTINYFVMKYLAKL